MTVLIFVVYGQNSRVIIVAFGTNPGNSSAFEDVPVDVHAMLPVRMFVSDKDGITPSCLT